MSAELFWLSNAQWEVILPHLPVKQRGPKRISDRTVISGIIHVLESGCTWRACPRAYGAYMTVFNRYNRWKQRGLWQRILAEVRKSDQFGDLSMCERLIRASACGASTADGIDSTRSASEKNGSHDLPAGFSKKEISTESLQLTGKLLLALECVNFYARGESDTGAYARRTIKALLAAHVEDPIALESCSNDNVEWAKVRLGAERDLPIEVAQGSGWQPSRTDLP
jgi:transposase